MSDQKFNLSGLMEHLNENGFSYSKEQVYNLIISLKTKPFIIISGISGTGKSKIVELIAEYMQEYYDYSHNYEIMAVKPNWTDSRGVFGYQNILDDTYSITQTVKVFLRALNNPNKSYFLVLDEMNLARVEHYFSDFLSLLESRKYKYKYSSNNNKITLTDEFKNELKNQFNRNITLSEAIILSALQNETDDFNNVEHYRNMPISEWWFEEYSDSSNLKVQFRSELNQERTAEVDSQLKSDGNRLAGKAFLSESAGNSYKLKTESEMDEETLRKFTYVKDKFNNAKAIVLESQERIIVQEKIDLHNSTEVLKTSSNQPDYNEVDFKQNERYYSDKNGYYVPAKLEIPINVFIVGTVNIDETTYSFSPKVLDRSNVIEFNDIDLYNAYGYGSAPTDDAESFLEYKELDFNVILPTSRDGENVLKNYNEMFETIISVFEILKNKNKHFGYRVINEISRYLLNFISEEASETEKNLALDFQILQKILPKLNGSIDELDDVLNDILTVCVNKDLHKSEDKLRYMIKELDSQGFTTFLK